MRYSICLGEPGSWEIEIGGSQAFVTEVATTIGLYTHGQPRPTPEPPASAPVPVAEPPAPAPAEPAGTSAEEDGQEASLDSFYARFMQGRQGSTLSEEELVILFGYYFEQVMGRDTWSGWEIMQCFGLLDLPKPANMIGLLSTMARQRGSIVPGEPGSYSLSERSKVMVETALRT
jgi:hypothetical protein